MEETLFEEDVNTSLGVYAPVLTLPDGYPVFDFSTGSLDEGMHGEIWGIGKFDEKRRDVYKIFYHGDRDVHMGIDIFGPVGTKVHAFADGEILLVGYNAEPGGYGATVICKHYLEDGREIFALYGHLSKASLEGKEQGQEVCKGEAIAWLGDRRENGGWAPHVHFQLSITAPETCDMPGVVSDVQLKEALIQYPDPRTVLGPVF